MRERHIEEWAAQNERIAAEAAGAEGVGEQQNTVRS